MEEKIWNAISTYAGPIFGYCIKRLNNIQDAEDLSQEILLEIVIFISKGIDVRNTDTYIWKIAHNRYARWLDKDSQTNTLSQDTLIDESFGENSDENIERQELISAAFRTIGRIAKSHRDILVDYYINELSYARIAKKHHLPVGTVKTRLFFGKQKIKERIGTIMNENEKLYQPINWHIMCNGKLNPYKYLDRQVARFICQAVYEKPLNEEEISSVTGIPCVIIEDELVNLQYGEAITRIGGKYQTNFIIHTKKMHSDNIQRLKTVAEQITPELLVELNQYDNTIQKVGFYGSQFPKDRLWWVLIPGIVRKAVEKAIAAIPGAQEPSFPLRRDGGYGWFVVYKCEETFIPYGSGCNGYWNGTNWTRAMEYFWTSATFSNEVNNNLPIANNMPFTRGYELQGLPESDLAQLIKGGLVKKGDDGFAWQIPVMTFQQHQELMGVLEQMSNLLYSSLIDAGKSIHEDYQNSVPKSLHRLIPGVITTETFTVIAIILEKLESTGILKKPVEKDTFTNQIWAFYR